MPIWAGKAVAGAPPHHLPLSVSTPLPLSVLTLHIPGQAALHCPASGHSLLWRRNRHAHSFSRTPLLCALPHLLFLTARCLLSRMLCLSPLPLPPPLPASFCTAFLLRLFSPALFYTALEEGRQARQAGGGQAVPSSCLLTCLPTSFTSSLGETTGRRTRGGSGGGGEHLPPEEERRRRRAGGLCHLPLSFPLARISHLMALSSSCLGASCLLPLLPLISSSFA